MADTTGNVATAGTLASTGDFAVNTNKFNVTASSGNTTVAGTVGVTGAATLSGGIVGGQRTRWQTLDTISPLDGTDTACDNGSIWVAGIYVPVNCVITGIEYVVGSVGGTDSVVVGLYHSGGTLAANSLLTGTVVGTAAQTQQVAFTSTYATQGPAQYWVALQFNGATAKLRTIPAYAGLGTNRIKQAGAFGTMATLSPTPSALVAGLGPIASTY